MAASQSLYAVYVDTRGAHVIVARPGSAYFPRVTSILALAV